MRKWHRWLGVIFATVLIVIAMTGMLLTVQEWVPTGSLVHTEGPPPSVSCDKATSAGAPESAHTHEFGAHPSGFGGPPSGFKALLLRIHSGQMFGAVGAWLSMLAGAALLFFSVSGVYMYIKMFEQRRQTGRNKFFWTR